jgi:hypothetical protein
MTALRPFTRRRGEGAIDLVRNTGRRRHHVHAKLLGGRLDVLLAWA